MESISAIEAVHTESLMEIGDYKLNIPITFDISYDVHSDFWCLENEELAINGYGRTYQACISNLEEELESHILCFNEFDNDNLSPESLKIKSKLSEYIDIQQAGFILNNKYIIFD